jgi:hypothetical protein
VEWKHWKKVVISQKEERKAFEKMDISQNTEDSLKNSTERFFIFIIYFQFDFRSKGDLCDSVDSTMCEEWIFG